jgi:ELWxxDGT repeat protein
VALLADDSLSGQELWITNGTMDSTFMIHDCATGSNATEFLNVVYYPGADGFFLTTLDENFHFLWYIDIHDFNVQVVQAFARAPDIDTNPLFVWGVLRHVNSKILLVSAYSPDVGVELYKVVIECLDEEDPASKADSRRLWRAGLLTVAVMAAMLFSS